MGMKGKEYFCAPRSTHITNLVSVPCHSCLPHRVTSSAGGTEGGEAQAGLLWPSHPLSLQVKRTMGVPGGRGAVSVCVCIGHLSFM